MPSRVCRYLSRWIVVLHAYWFGTGQRYKYHLSFLELFGVLVKTQSGRGWWDGPALGGLILGGGVATCLGLDEWLHGFLVFYCERWGPLAAICFHRGPRKTMRWVQGLSSIVLSCRGTQRAGWSGQRSQEKGAGLGHIQAAFPREPVGCEPASLWARWQPPPPNTHARIWLFSIQNPHCDRCSLFLIWKVGNWKDVCHQ